PPPRRPPLFPYTTLFRSGLKFRYTAPAGEVNVRFEGGGERVSAVVTVAQGQKEARPKPAGPPPSPPRRPAPQLEEGESHGIEVGPGAADAGVAMERLLELMLEHGA